MNTKARGKLYELRKNLKWSLQDMGSAIGVSESYVSRLEAGSRSPSETIAYNIEQLCITHGVEIQKNDLYR